MEYIIISCIIIVAIVVALISTIVCKKCFSEALSSKNEYKRYQEDIAELTNKKNQLDDFIEVGKSLLEDINYKIEFKNLTLKDLNEQYCITKDRLNDIQNIANEKENRLKRDYEDATQKYKDDLESFKESCAAEKALVQYDLNSLKKTRHTAIELWRQQEQDKKQIDGYKLNITPQDKKDIQLLQNIQLQFSHPRVISKLIWQTYFQPLAKQQFVMILGNTTKTGIYKITNTLDNKCYIGQAVDVYKRWCDHCKCGCGIDTPKNNRLYIAMKQDGVENFTFELLEECPREELNKKEAFYIDLYESNDYGYNQTVGNN